MEYKSQIETVLDEAYERNLKVDPNNVCEYYNPLFKGMSGIGKTAITRKWLDEHEDEINPIYLSSTWLKVNQINIPEKKTYMGIEWNVVSDQLFRSETIDSFEKEKSVVFIDDYQLANEDVKQHIRLLLNRKVFDSRMEGGIRKLNNLLMVIVAETE